MARLGNVIENVTERKAVVEDAIKIATVLAQDKKLAKEIEEKAGLTDRSAWSVISRLRNYEEQNVERIMNIINNMEVDDDLL